MQDPFLWVERPAGPVSDREDWEDWEDRRTDAQAHPRQAGPPRGVGSPEDMNLPGFDFHALRGFSPTRYMVHVNGPWCITFEFDGKDAAQVDFEQYH
jgi:hypothetical protein